MKKYFTLIFLVLIAASFLIYWSMPDQQTDIPVLSWKSDPNPQRYEQIELFQEWLKKNGHVDEKGRPLAMLTLDAANNQSAVIQAVSGVGGDMIDTAGVLQFYGLGVTSDLSAAAARGGFSLADTYPGLKGTLDVNGVQHAYPCNVNNTNLWSNLDTLKKYGFDAPPEVWTPEEFEKMGIEFVKRANRGKAYQDTFFIAPLSSWNDSFHWAFVRSLGYDLYNETLTRAAMDNEAFLKLFKYIYKWTFIDRI